MPIQNPITLDIDIKKKNYISEPVVTSNDSNIFIINITDNDLPVDLNGVTTVSLAHTRLDRKVVVTEGEVTGTNQVTFELGTTETALAGRVEAVAQLYTADGRVSTLAFSYKVEKDPTGASYQPSEVEQTLIQIVLGDAPLIIQEAQDAVLEATAAATNAELVAKENKTHFLNAVGTVALRDSTYPNPTHGDTVRVTSTSTTYRFVEGAGWIVTDVYNPTAIDQVTAQLADNVTLAIKNDVSSDDTTQIQSAIDSASATSGVVRLSKGKTYIVGSLIPKRNVILDLNGSTLKLKNNTNLPLIYDWLSETIRSNFGVINGTLDCNMANNSDAINQSAGGLWLTNWDNLYFRNLVIINAFRNVFNLFGVRNVVAENIHVKDCGKSNSNNFYSYGFSLESSPQRRNSNIVLRNFICENIYGFGIHVRRTDGFDLSNIQLNDLSRLNDAIGITLTDATLGKINGVNIKKTVKPFSVDSHAIEINTSKNVTLENIQIDGVSTSSILFGDNGSALSSTLVKLSNVKTTNTGQFSMSINFIDGLLIENSDFDKGFTNTYALPAKNVLFSRCKFAVVCNNLMMYRAFGYRDTIFLDLFILEKINETVRIGYSFSLTDTSVKSINLSVVSIEQAFIGGVDIITKWANNFGQGSFVKYDLYAYGGAIQNSVLGTKIIGSAERLPLISFTGNSLNITNNTGGTILVNVLFTNKSITGLSLT